MSATNRVSKRLDRDNYPTPAWCTRELVRHLGEDKPPSRILEPCAGSGAVVDVLLGLWPTSKVVAVEIDAERARQCRARGGVGALTVLQDDFLSMSINRFDLVVTNPPFAAAVVLQIIQKAISIGSTTAMLLPVTWCFGGTGRIEFRRQYPFDVLAFGRRPQFVRHVNCGATRGAGCNWDGWFSIDDNEWPRTCPKCVTKTRSTTSDSTEYCWAIWGSGRGNRWFQADLDNCDEKGTRR